jgi:1-deoxy-D-xylulose-5-phosphate reductoisomerase
LQNQIGFLSMSDIIEEVIQKVAFINTPTLQEYIASDAQAREQAQELIKTNSYKH